MRSYLISQIATFRIPAEHAAAFEAEARGLVQFTAENEPGTLVFRLCRSKEDQTVFRILEVYTDEEAMKAHIANPNLRETLRRMKPLWLERPQVEVLEVLA